MRIVLFLLLWSTQIIQAQHSPAAVQQLQHHLKEAGWYRGPIDGAWSKRLQRNLQRFQEKDTFYQKLVRPFPKTSTPDPAEASALQKAVNEIGNNMSKARSALQKIQDPLARLFEAYTYFAGSVRTENQRRVVNDLVAKALRQAFPEDSLTPYVKTPLPFEGSIESSKELLLLIRELNSLSEAPIIYPCWLFRQEGMVFLEVLEQQMGAAPAQIAKGCTQFLQEVPSLAATYRLCQRFSQNTAKPTLRCQGRQIILYLAPRQIDTSQPEALEAWNESLPEAWQQQGAAQESELQSLAILYSLSQLHLEKYFQERQFTPEQAHLLALAVLKSHLCGFFEES